MGRPEEAALLRTAFTELVGCHVPVQQAPMGAISPPGLALAVARAGGLGSINVVPDADRSEVATRFDGLAAAGAGVLAAAFLADRADPATVAVAANRVRVVDFFWARPDRRLVDVAHDGGALVNWQVGSLPDAVTAAEAGVDIVTVQGTEAGGHVHGGSPLHPLLAAVLRAVDVPVLAAGGIADARTLAAVLAAGAAGARIGTRFVASRETGAHPEYVLAVLAAGPESTEITDAFALCPMCETLPRARVLSSAIEAVGALDGDVVGSVHTPEGLESLPARSGMPPHHGMHGDVHAMALYAGQGVHLVNEVQSVAQIMRDLTDGAEELLRVW